MISIFEKPYDPKAVEDKIYKKWEESGYFNPDNLPVVKGQMSKVKGQFTICLPPPNVTGTLHMGHALNATIQDILIRKKRMEGYKTLWIPGTDHAGIATQNVVEKQLKKEGISRHQLGKEEFLKKVWEWKQKYGDIILGQLKKIGASCDWSRTAFTMDESYSKAVKEAFNHYHKKGWIYQGERVVNWCPKDGTSLSDLELEHEEEKTKLWYIKYPIKKTNSSKLEANSYIVIVTTRPETMLGDSAVAVNPKALYSIRESTTSLNRGVKNGEIYLTSGYYIMTPNAVEKFNEEENFFTDNVRSINIEDLVKETIILPIQNREIPIVADILIDKDFGTGAVKVTPAHDFTDGEIGQRHNLPIYKIINEIGKMTELAGEDFKGLKILECREKVIEKLKELGLLLKEEDYTHSVAKCYRCNGTVEPLPSLQWFLKMDELAKLAVKAVESGDIKFYPQRWEKVYLDWNSKIKDWCISRQIWWGHKIPIDGVDDVMDTWFSSALWPLATLGWPEKSKDFAEFYPTQVLVTARDIINLWVSRMVFSGLEFTGKKPFSDVIINATTLTKDGKRMSKSLGTGIDPLGLIDKYGADATRFGLIWQSMGGQDIHWAEEHVMAGKKFSNKLWNISRFVLTKCENLSPELPAPPSAWVKGVSSVIASGAWQSQIQDNQTKEILKKLEETKKSVSKDIDEYNFGQALHTLYDFIWHDFADVYIEYSKDKDSEEIHNTLYFILYTILKILHPFMPFVTEEIYQNLPSKEKDFLMVDSW